MKKTFLKNSSLRLASILIAIIFCINMGDTTNNTNIDGTGSEPDVNFYGIVLDTSGNEFEAHNICISRKYNKISVYSRPTAPDIDPTINKTYIDLIELMHLKDDFKNSIEVKNPGKLETFKGRDYIAVTFTPTKGESDTYLIEANRTITCGKIQGETLEEKEIHFQALKSIKIISIKEPKKKIETEKMVKKQVNDSE